MRFSPECDWGANAGLKLARDFLEPLKAKYPHVSYADLWTLAGVVAIENMGGPKIPWRHGRTDATGPTTVPDGRLPAADSGSRQKDAAHIREIFGRQGFTDREMVALIGCHAVGRCHTDASGYWGPWTNAETTFSNDYFRLLLEESWTLKTTHMGKVSNTVPVPIEISVMLINVVCTCCLSYELEYQPWNGPAQYEDKTGQLMMLPADLALVKDPEFRKIVEVYAKDEKAFFDDFSAAFSKVCYVPI
jgi:cytochrome c peroxidase